MTDLHTAITEAIDYLSTQAVEVPPDAWKQIVCKGALKAETTDDLSAINARYHTSITEALLTYLEGGTAAGPKNSFKKATVEAFGSAADAGWIAGGGDLPFMGDALDFFNARLEAELGYVDLLFQQAKELRKDEEFDPLSWASARADGYINTLKEIYNNLKLRVMDNVMVTFDGDDGAESCDTCKKLKGKRHKISWFIANNYVPPFGSGLDCAKGGQCQHGLRKDNGEWITI